MTDARLPRLLFWLLVAVAAVQNLLYYPRLPGVVASHFDVHGVANGWQTKSAFLGVFLAVSVLAAIVGFGIPRIIAAVPPQLINLPNKRYWLAPEHLAETREFLSRYFAWFGCAIFLIIILTFNYAVQSNLHPEHRPDVSRLWYILAGFLAFTIVWTIRMLSKFLRLPQDNSTPK